MNLNNNDKGEQLIMNLDKVHTTEMGIERIKRNLCLSTEDVVAWCRKRIMEPDSNIVRIGKNWYVNTSDCVITVNAYSFTIITAHKPKANKNPAGQAL